MPEKEEVIPLARILSIPNSKDFNKGYIKIMLGEDVPVFCVNKGKHTQKLIPFKPLYDSDNFFWQKKGDWEYFLTGYGLQKLEEKAKEKLGSFVIPQASPSSEKSAAEPVKKETAAEPEKATPQENTESHEETAFGGEYEEIVEMSKEEKVERLNKDSVFLNELLIRKSRDQIVIAEALSNTTKDTALINHAVLKEIAEFADDQAKAFSKEIVNHTSEIVKSSAQLLSENVFSDELMNKIAEKSKGTVMQHITRVYLNGVAFLAYFNNKVSSSSTIMKIRSAFNLKYRKFYQAMLPHIDTYDLTLDKVFMGGLREIPADMFFKWSIGFFIHDIGKAAEIEYHEGEAAYDREKVMDHVKVGYESVVKKTNYPREAGHIIGYHHEYFGDSNGYGTFREYLQKYREKNPNAKHDFCIAYELENILTHKAFAYFPAKVLEIIDVYDSLTDPRRVYKKAMTLDEALDMMYREFIIKHKKIDPILYDVFTGFIREKEAG